MNEEEMITITKKEYDDLLDDSLWLEALEQNGVDNWSGFSYAQDLIREWKEE